MKKNLTFLSLAVFFAGIFTCAYAQVSVGGTPVSFLVSSLNSARVAVPLVEMPKVDADALKREDLVRDREMNKPLRFGKRLEVALNPDNAGVWHSLGNGDRLWRVTILSKGAMTMNFIFSKFKLPEGAQLFIYNANHSDVIGAFTSANNQPNEMLGTTLVKGQEVTIEYYEPAYVASPGKLEIGTVVHGYRSIPAVKSEDSQARFGDSGSCNININCTQGNDWQSQKRSVARIIVNGGDWCTGALINNTAKDGKAYFLTADHCFSNNVSTWVFWFNYEASGCANPANEPGNQSMSGSQLKARNATSDFCLLQLNQKPPANYNVFYAGWNRSSSVSGSGASIHHPSGDIKKISLATITSADANFWKASWTTASITEPGSSGSPLFDSNKRIVGQLQGGPSFCGVAPANKHDFYGKFSVSWNTGSTASKRLKDWLAPDGSNPTTLNGLNATSLAALAVSPANENVVGTDQPSTFQVNATDSWEVVSTDSWIEVNPATKKGAGNQQIQASYKPNTTGITRKGTITIRQGSLVSTVSVTQLGSVKEGSIQQMLTDRDVSMSPNPATDLVQVRFPGLKGQTTVTVFDLVGHRLRTQVTQEAELSLNTQQLPGGVYVIKVTTQDGRTYARKVVLMKE